MQAHIFEGYFENGRFYNNERQIVKIPERYKVYVTLFDEPLEISSEKSAAAEKKDRRAAFGCLKGKIHVPDDFNEPIDDFKEYM